MMRTPSTTNGSAASNTSTGPPSVMVSLLHMSPEVPPPAPSALPLTEFTCRMKSTFVSVAGAVQVRVHETWSFPASVCPTSFSLYNWAVASFTAREPWLAHRWKPPWFTFPS